MSRPLTYPGTHRHTKSGFKEPLILILGQAPRHLTKSALFLVIPHEGYSLVVLSLCTTETISSTWII